MANFSLVFGYLFDNWLLTFAPRLFALAMLIPIWRLTFHSLARFPGPKLWAATRLPWHMYMHLGLLHHKILQLHIKYGPIVRIAPDELSIVHEDVLRDVLSNKNFEKNRYWFKPQRGAQKGQSIMSFNEDDHARIRRGFMGAFTEHGVSQMAPVIEKNVDLLIEQLKKQTDEETGKPVVNLVEWVNYTTFDIVGELAFGESFGSIAQGKAHPWVAINLGFGSGVALGTSLAYLSPLDSLMSFIIPKHVREMFVYHQQLSQTQVGKRLSSPEEKPDFLGSALAYNKGMLSKGEDHKIITRDEMNQNMAIFVFAGSETSASALASTLRYLLQNPDAMEKLETEVLDAFGSVDDVTYPKYNKLSYMNAALNEGMRLGAPSVNGVPRVAMVDSTVCGKRIPKGTHVSINQFAAYRYPHNFIDPNVFRPERFLEREGSSLDKMAMFQPFYIGRHQCIGYRMAWCVLRVVLTKLILAFEMELEDPASTEDYGRQAAYLVWEKEPLQVRLRRRAK